MKEFSLNTILICNVHSTKNKGDLALLQQTIYYAKKAYHPKRIVVMANWFEEQPLKQLADLVLPSPYYLLGCRSNTNSPLYKIISYIKSKRYLSLFKNHSLHKIPSEWLTIFREISNADLVIGVSGNQIYSRGRHFWILPAITYPYEIANWAKKPTILFPQTIGPLRYRYEKIIIKKSLKSVTKIYLRDSESIKLLKEIGIEAKKFQFMDDLAFSLPYSPLNKKTNENPKEPKGIEPRKIGFSIISSMKSYLPTTLMDCYYKEISLAIEQLIDNFGYEIHLFSQVVGPTEEENDKIGISEVLRRINLKNKEKLTIHFEELEPNELKAHYGQMDVFIASRLHSGIFSLGASTPTIFIGYLPKTIGILNQIGMQDMYLYIEQLRAVGLIEKIQEVFSNYAEVKSRSAGILALISSRLSNFVDDLRDVIDENTTNNSLS